MQITHMSLAKVAHGGTPAAAELREIDGGINAFLSDHISGLRRMTERRKTSPGQFVDLHGEPQQHFRELYLGPDEAFLTAASALTKRLIGRMDGRAAAGLLVCVRAHDAHERYGGLLKLQVVAPHAAVLEELESGEVKLSAVTDLLDKPGDLQKGALRTSWLAEDRVLVGDQLAQDAAYFPTAFGIKIFARASSSVSGLLAAVDEIEPELTSAVAEALPSVQPGEVTTVLTSLESRVPGLARVRPDIMHALGSQARPVALVDTKQRATETIKAGAITISGPVTEMRKHVHIDSGELAATDGDARWVVRVQSASEPRRMHP